MSTTQIIKIVFSMLIAAITAILLFTILISGMANFLGIALTIILPYISILLIRQKMKIIGIGILFGVILNVIISSAYYFELIYLP
jgi:hypothetical protein